MMFLGNPPKTWDDETHSNLDMLDSFGDYTYQILSRLTLIFTQMSISGPDAEQLIEEKIMDAMNGKFDDPEVKREMNMWRVFGREYLRKVSLIRPQMDAEVKGLIRSTYHDYLKNTEAFRKRQEKISIIYHLVSGFCQSRCFTDRRVGSYC